MSSISGFVSKLKILNILHNPIVTPPKDIIALGCSSILNYLRIEWNKLHPDEPVTFVERKNFQFIYCHTLYLHLFLSS